MKIILTVKSGKGTKTKRKELDETVDLVAKLDDLLSKQLKGYKSKGKAFFDGTGVEYEK